VVFKSRILNHAILNHNININKLELAAIAGYSSRFKASFMLA